MPRSSTLANSVYQSPDLNLAVKSLADGIQTFMAAFFSLQTATINALARAPDSNTILDDLESNRKIFRIEWERGQCFICQHGVEEF